MPGSRRTVRWLLLAAAGTAWAAAGLAGRPAGTGERLHQALGDLRAGDYAKADRLATQLALDAEDPTPRAWIIAATARQNLGQYASAIRAYRLFLASSQHPQTRQFVNRQVMQCQAALDGRPPGRPGAELSDRDRADLAQVSEETFTESSEHFVVRARNARLAKLLAEQSERALVRVCRAVLAGQEYPHSVEVHVWPDRREYLASAPAAEPWSAGSFSLTVRGGLTTRRIDLTQRAADGQFDVGMLDRVLPHEMCHLVVAELFGDAPCPPFLNEGLAMLAEWEVNNHRLELAGTALAGKARISPFDLLVVRPDQVRDPAAFYGEAYSLAGYLRRRMTDRQFADFLEHLRGGCDVADAAQRALHVPDSPQFLPALARAWENHAIDHAQMIRALRGQSALAPPAP